MIYNQSLIFRAKAWLFENVYNMDMTLFVNVISMPDCETVGAIESNYRSWNDFCNDCSSLEGPYKLY